MRVDGDETDADNVASCSVVRTTMGLVRFVALGAATTSDEDVAAAIAEEVEDKLVGAEDNLALAIEGAGTDAGAGAGTGAGGGTGADPGRGTCGATDARGGVEATTTGGGDESPFDGLLKSSPITIICKLPQIIPRMIDTTHTTPVRQVAGGTSPHMHSRRTVLPTAGTEPNPTVCG